MAKPAGPTVPSSEISESLYTNKAKPARNYLTCKTSDENLASGRKDKLFNIELI